MDCRCCILIYTTSALCACHQDLGSSPMDTDGWEGDETTGPGSATTGGSDSTSTSSASDSTSGAGSSTSEPGSSTSGPGSSTSGPGPSTSGPGSSTSDGTTGEPETGGGPKSTSSGSDTSGDGPQCGDGVTEGDEACDDDEGCASDCTWIDPCPSGDIIFVDGNATGAGDGSSWANAFISPQLAMLAAQPGDTVWIAQGTYRAVAAHAPVLSLTSCVDVIGGFEGNESSVDERPTPRAVTELSGDFNDDDVDAPNADNSFHVILGIEVEHLELDGIVVTAGFASGTGENGQGAGLFLPGSSVALRDVTVRRNVSEGRGGGIYASESSLTITGCRFTDNRSNFPGGGGAIHRDGAGHFLQVENSVFERNSRRNISVSGGTTEIYDSDFADNFGLVGGAIFHSSSDGELRVDNCQFVDNGGDRGAAIAAYGSEPTTVSNCLFDRNSAFDGGAFYGRSPTTITSSTFVDNEARYNGGAIEQYSYALAVFDSAFENNTAMYDGGGAIHFRNTGQNTIDATTFSGNRASYGGAVFQSNNCGTTYTDAAFEDNEATGTRGGALHQTRGQSHVIGGRFESNSSTTSGGAISAPERAHITIDDTLFAENHAQVRGGAIYTGDTAFQATNGVVNLEIFDTVFRGNSAASAEGGAIALHYAAGASSYTIASCSFAGNAAADDGGAIWSRGHNMDVLDTSFSGNVAGGYGGALWTVAREDGIPRVRSSTIYGNSATDGGGIFTDDQFNDGGVIEITNVVLWGNGTDLAGSGSAEVTYTCSQEYLSTSPTNVVALTDPVVVGDQGELFLAPSSACIDSGNDGAASDAYESIALDWGALTTTPNGSIDVPPVDPGAHYVP
jgi:predicted outer membrane repeat protein